MLQFSLLHLFIVYSSALLKRYSGAIIRFSDSSSLSIFYYFYLFVFCNQLFFTAIYLGFIQIFIPPL